MANGKKKGNRGERAAVAFLKEWTGKEFSRVPQSGGLRWKSQKTVTGDVICTEEGHYCSFSIEVKNYNELNFQHLLIEDVNSKILKFWEQCKEDASRVSKVPLLLMRRNGMAKNSFFIVLPYPLVVKFLIPHTPKPITTPYLVSRLPGEQLFISTTAYLSTLPYKIINKKLRKHLRSI